MNLYLISMKLNVIMLSIFGVSVVLYFIEVLSGSRKICSINTYFLTNCYFQHYISIIDSTIYRPCL